MFCLLTFYVSRDLFPLSCLALILWSTEKCSQWMLSIPVRDLTWYVWQRGQKSWKRLSGSGHLLLSVVSLNSPALPSALESLWEVCNEGLHCFGRSLSVLLSHSQHLACAYVLGVLSQLSYSAHNFLHKHLVRPMGKIWWVGIDSLSV